MDTLKKGLLELLLSPTFQAMVVIAIAFVVVRRWLHFRNHRKARDEQIAALKPLAAQLGGSVIGPDDGDTTAWPPSADPRLIGLGPWLTGST